MVGRLALQAWSRAYRKALSALRSNLLQAKKALLLDRAPELETKSALDLHLSSSREDLQKLTARGSLEPAKNGRRSHHIGKDSRLSSNLIRTLEKVRSSNLIYDPGTKTVPRNFGERVRATAAQSGIYGSVPKPWAPIPEILYKFCGGGILYILNWLTAHLWLINQYPPLTRPLSNGLCSFLEAFQTPIAARIFSFLEKTTKSDGQLSQPRPINTRAPSKVRRKVFGRDLVIPLDLGGYHF